MYFPSPLNLTLPVFFVLLGLLLWVKRKEQKGNTGAAEKGTFPKFRMKEKNRFLKELSKDEISVTPQRVFNRPEAHLFYITKRALETLDLLGWHIHGQIGYGSLFKISSKTNEDIRALYNFNKSLSMDMVIADNYGNPRLVIEYQGSGHDPKNDNFKRRLCDKAHVTFLAVRPKTNIEKPGEKDILESDETQAEIMAILHILASSPSP